MADDKIDVDCPEDGCSGKLRVTLEDIAGQRTRSCNRGHSVNLVDDGGGAKKTLKALKDLTKKLGG